MRARLVPILLTLAACGADPRLPVVEADSGPAALAPPSPLLPPAPPTPGHLAVDRRGLPCILRSDGLVACDRFGHPAELLKMPSPVRWLSRSEEWICTHHADATRCRRGEEEASFAADARVTAGGRTVCSALGDRLTCLGAGTDRPGERLEHVLTSSPSPLEAVAVDDGVLCGLGAGGRLRCLTLAEPVATSLTLADTPLTSVDVAGAHVCGLDDQGMTHCGTVDGATPLQPVPGAPAAQTLAIGRHHACVLSALGHVACWRHPTPDDDGVLPAPYIVDLPLHDVVALDADGTFTASLDARRGLHRWAIGPDDGQLLVVHPEPLMGLDNPAPPATPECAGCRWVTQLGDGRCVKDPNDAGVVTTYATCAVRCCWVPPGWSL